MVDRTVLLIAYHFPPIQGSSGVQRTLRFAQHLPSLGWRPIVLTITPGAYETSGHSSGNEIPEGLEVRRAFGLDAAQQLSLFGRYPQFLALPDRWMTWRFRAIPSAMRIIREQHVDVIWSTFPIATAHQIGLAVARRSGLPWIAEFRDPMWQGDYPPEPALNKAWLALEAEIFAHAQRIVVTTPGAEAAYAARYPDIDPARLSIIENGFDEETFRRAEALLAADTTSSRAPGSPITLLHSGVIYRNARDPSQLFAAIGTLKAAGTVSAATLRVVLRDSGDDGWIRQELQRQRIEDIVRLKPAIDYLSALREMLSVDGLLLLQSSNCNAQVPAKLYEYLRAGRPLIALTDPEGDTAKTLSTAAAGMISRLDSEQDIRRDIVRFLDQIRSGRARLAPSATVNRYSRQVQSGRLAQLLHDVVSATD